MPATLVDANAAVMCAHGSKAQPLVQSPRVKAGGAPILTIASTFSISGCPNMMGQVSFPCVTATFVAGAVRVTSMNQPVLLQDGTALATPTGMKLSVASTQMRVKGQ